MNTIVLWYMIFVSYIEFFTERNESGVVLIQLLITLHVGWRNFYYQLYINIWSLFSVLCNWMDCLPLHLLSIIFKLISCILSESGCVHLISKQISASRIDLWEMKEIFGTINLKFKRCVWLRGTPFPPPPPRSILRFNSLTM